MRGVCVVWRERCAAVFGGDEGAGGRREEVEGAVITDYLLIIVLGNFAQPFDEIGK